MSPKNEANNLLGELGIISLPIIPEKLCEKLEINYLEKPLQGFDGLLIIDPIQCRGLICINSLIREEGRKNFTGAHELGHYCMDGLNSNEFYCASNVIGATAQKHPPIELRANEFAAELLMPTFLFQGLVEKHEPGWDNIKKLATICHTSDLATAFRFVELTEESCALLVCKNNKITYFRKSKNFNLFIDMESRYVASGTPTDTALRGGQPDDTFEPVKADNWISGKRINKYSEILEWALPMNPYGQVLTLLYDEEGIGETEEDNKIYSSSDTEWVWEPPTFHKSKRKR